MVTVVSLTPEEASIAMYGSVPEPSFKPFPGSVRERELEEEREREFDDWSADLEPDDEEPGSRDDHAALAEPADRVLTRVGAAQRWRRTTREPALLGVEDERGRAIIAFGTVEGRTRAAHRGTRNLEIRVRYVLNRRIHLDEITQELSSRQSALLDDMLTGPLRPLSPKLGTAILQALVAAEPEVANILRSIREQLNAEAIAEARARVPKPAVLTQEAMSSALRFFSAKWNRVIARPSPAPSAFALQLEESAGIVENDVITDDSVVFPGWDRSEFSTRGWWEFRDGDRRLLIKNINVSPQESRTGADLVYVRRDPDAFVLVQYKLLTQLANGRLVFRPDGRLDRQVARMLHVETTSGGAVQPDDAETYRIGPGFSFVKFVFPAAASSGEPGALLPGFYLPSEYARRVLLSPEKGPQGGLVHYVADHRSIPPDIFARLVRDTWIGSTGDATALLRQVFGLRNSDVDLVLAVDEPLEAEATDPD